MVSVANTVAVLLISTIVSGKNAEITKKLTPIATCETINIVICSFATARFNVTASEFGGSSCHERNSGDEASVRGGSTVVAQSH